MDEETGTDLGHGRLRDAVSSFLDIYVSKPALETISKDIDGQARIANTIVLILIVTDEIRSTGSTFDAEYLRSLPQDEIEKRISALGRFLELQDISSSEHTAIVDDAYKFLSTDSSKIYLIEYFMRELTWITVSLLSASYVSAFVLMRAAFELIVGIATRSTGGMSDRIMSIGELDATEKKNMKDLWYRLCAWGHPYGKWVEEVCPVFVQHRPMYHPKLFVACANELMKLVDFFVVVAIGKYQLDHHQLAVKLKEGHVDVVEYEMLCSRVGA